MAACTVYHLAFLPHLLAATLEFAKLHMLSARHDGTRVPCGDGLLITHFLAMMHAVSNDQSMCAMG